MSSVNGSIFMSFALRSSAALLLFFGVVHAQTESFNSNAGLLGPVSTTNSIVLPSFNAGLGTLESVVVTLKFNICPELTINNSTSAALAFNNLKLSALFGVTGPGGFNFHETLSTYSLAGTAATGSSNYMPDTGWIYEVKTINSSDLAAWQGTSSAGTINLAVTPDALYTNQSALPKGLTASGTAVEWENISVTYKYASTAAVPEPSGKSLTYIVAAFMISVIAWRRLRSSLSEGDSSVFF